MYGLICMFKTKLCTCGCEYCHGRISSKRRSMMTARLDMQSKKMEIKLDQFFILARQGDPPNHHACRSQRSLCQAYHFATSVGIFAGAMAIPSK